MIYAELVKILNQDLEDHGIPCPDELVRMYVLLALILGNAVTQEDIHDAWSMWCVSVNPSHKALLPFKDLSAETKALDEPYVRAVRRLSDFIDENFR